MPARGRPSPAHPFTQASASEFGRRPGRPNLRHDGATDRVAAGSRWLDAGTYLRMKHLDVNVGVLSGLLPASSTHPTSVTIRLAAAPMSHFTRRFLFLASRNDRQPGIDGLRESARERHFKNRGSAMEDRLLYRVPDVALILTSADQRCTSCSLRASLNP